MLRYLASVSLFVALLGCSKPEEAGPSGASAPAKPAGKESPAPPPKKEGPPAAAPAPPPNPTDDPALAACDRFIAEQGTDRSRSGWKTSLPAPPKLPFDAKRTYYWMIETNQGPIKVKLLPEVAPMHASSTIYLSRLGFYDGLTFHRVIPGFMAQGGCPRGTGSGGPGYEYDGEFDSKVRHSKPGLLSMANRGPGTDGSQFFLTFAPTAWLDGKHTIFGEVVDGTATLKKLEQRGSPGGATSEKLLMTKTTIEVE
jgi:cyclophilin family peptidyl-prolyl cis-trans isomerase